RDVGATLGDAEGPAEHFGCERGAAHAADDCALEAVAPDFRGERLQLRDMGLHPLDECEPAEAVGDLRLMLRLVRLPQRRVPGPQARAYSRFVHLADGGLYAARHPPEGDLAAFRHL